MKLRRASEPEKYIIDNKNKENNKNK